MRARHLVSKVKKNNTIQEAVDRWKPAALEELGPHVVPSKKIAVTLFLNVSLRSGGPLRT
jgi:hypothetical protein